MNEHAHFVDRARLERVAKALQRNRMQATVVNTAAEVAPLVKDMLQAGQSIGHGGSLTLEECGVMDLLRSGEYDFMDRALAKTPEAQAEVMHRHFMADVYLASANAVTEEGELFFVDGRGNRVAALTYGPASVILVVGKNKVVDDADAARMRNYGHAAPANAHRLGCATPCATTGECADCRSPGRICCAELLLGPQLVEGRIKVILVCEELGF